jgi:hypothetical protein
MAADLGYAQFAAAMAMHDPHGFVRITGVS